MKTDQLIAILSQDDTEPRPIAPRVMSRAGLAMVILGTALVAALGIRPDLGQVVSDPIVLMKWIFPLSAAALALNASMRLSRPEVRQVPAQRWLAIIGITAFLWLVASMFAGAQDGLWATMKGNTLAACLTSITSLALIPMGVGMMVLKDGASSSPMRSGLFLGIAAGGFSAALYALHCNEDSPLFFLSWYGLAILAVGALGALIGRSQLRW
ncbi:DUF1109 domain-containing protein [Paracoccus sp. Z330]|uniref:DUF1109 domain-containing protein n=1 Tax=Paracoccus onchidii TaxID=3017813 RepID=A0ABT4ZB70_9RHOB|nr:DUF1109 domain-containing protein [Paracoccus onchidii]MDB6176604.1 DUF1109 domain-containing protein [Paracoccus onchidii]